MLQFRAQCEHRLRVAEVLVVTAKQDAVRRAVALCSLPGKLTTRQARMPLPGSPMLRLSSKG